MTMLAQTFVYVQIKGLFGMGHGIYSYPMLLVMPPYIYRITFPIIIMQMVGLIIFGTNSYP